MSVVDNISLPPWALNQRGHELIEQIIANPPETRIVDAMGFRVEIYRTYQRPDVAELKRMYADWWEQNFETATEQPDALIRRALDEAAELRPELLPENRDRWVA